MKKELEVRNLTPTPNKGESQGESFRRQPGQWHRALDEGLGGIWGSLRSINRSRRNQSLSKT